MSAVLADRAIEMALAVCLTAGGSWGDVPVVASRSEEGEVPDEAVVVECLKAMQPMPGERVWQAEVNVFYQGDRAERTRGSADEITGRISAGVMALEADLQVTFDAETGTEAGRGRPGFAVLIWGQPAVVSTGPESEEPDGSRKRRDGVKLVCGFSVEAAG
jgi:hypothetical protein